MVHGRDFAGKKFVVLDPEGNRGLTVVGCSLDPQHSRTASHARIFTHCDFGRHRERDLDCLSLAEHKIRTDERAARAEIQRESVSRLPIAGL